MGKGEEVEDMMEKIEVMREERGMRGQYIGREMNERGRSECGVSGRCKERGEGGWIREVSEVSKW